MSAEGDLATVSALLTARTRTCNFCCELRPDGKSTHLVEAVRYFWRAKARAKVGKCREVDFARKLPRIFLKGTTAPCSAEKSQ